MNACAQAIEHRNNPDAISTRRLVAAAMLAILLMNLTVALAGADQKTTFKNNSSQNEWVSDCRLIGATPHREATHVVSCTTNSGQKTTCDFNQKPANCVVTPPPKQSAAQNGNVVGDVSVPTGNIEQADTGTAAPGDASGTGGVLIGDTQVASVETDGSTIPVVSGAESEDAAPSGSTETAADESEPAQAAPVDAESLPTFEQAGS